MTGGGWSDAFRNKYLVCMCVCIYIYVCVCVFVCLYLCVCTKYGIDKPANQQATAIFVMTATDNTFLATYRS